MKLKLFFLLLFTFFSHRVFNAQEHKNIAITFDDLPTLSHNLLDSTQQINYFKRILSVLENHNIIATGFVVGRLVKPFNSYLIGKFLDKGHFVGNHTYSHFDLNETSCNNFQNDIEKNDNLISHFYKNKPKYFRYPMLHCGDSKIKRDSIKNYLKENNFVIAPVTIDNDEFKYNAEFDVAFFYGDSTKMKEIGTQYLKHMIVKSQYFENLGYEIENRTVNHILLLHMNLINSFFLDDLLNWYKLNNWNFISLEKALSDKIYQYEDKYYGKKGLSWLERITYEN